MPLAALSRMRRWCKRSLGLGALALVAGTGLSGCAGTGSAAPSASAVVPNPSALPAPGFASARVPTVAPTPRLAPAPKLSVSKLAPKRLKPPQAQQRPSSEGLPAAAQRAALSLGARGDAVRALNARLYALHYLPAPQGGEYGSATRDAVIAFQKWEGLAREGVAGPQTQDRLATATPPTPLLSQPGRRVEVSLSKQLVLEVSDGQVLWAIHVSTGMPRLDTPPGRFAVVSKYLRSWSTQYHEWLPYASYFDRGIALHGLDLVPTYAGSHGCVRVPMEFAPILYQFDTIGTEVDVLS